MGLHRGISLATIFLAIILSSSAHAQTYTVIHNFTGGGDGAAPKAGMVIDRGGNFYGTATEGGCDVCAGLVFQLKREGSGWALNPLHVFGNTSDLDGEAPAAVTIGPNGTVYGTTLSGGGECDPDECGAIYNVFPPASVCKTALCPWRETIIHDFTPFEGHEPGYGPPVFDHAGSLYGTTSIMSDVYEASLANGHWSLSALYSFTGGPDGTAPLGGVIFDSAGNLYGTTSQGGISQCNSGCGTVFELSPSVSGWTIDTLHPFQGGSDGQTPVGGLIFDAAGNLYGSTSSGGSGGGGTIFELSPSNGSWTLTTLYSFSGSTGPNGSLTMDSSGNLYGTALLDGAHSLGSVFKLTKTGGSWTFSSLHDFTGGSDGGQPYGSVALDTSGNLYGTASLGGSTVGSCDGGLGCGVIWEITP